MKKVRIEVTAEDIRRGQRWNSYHCPIALAVNRALGVDDARAGLAYIGRDASTLATLTPADAGEFIVAFDRGEKVEPFEFEIDWPDCTA